jgi:hypothetical protein
MQSGLSVPRYLLIRIGGSSPAAIRLARRDQLADRFRLVRAAFSAGHAAPAISAGLPAAPYDNVFDWR